MHKYRPAAGERINDRRIEQGLAADLLTALLTGTKVSRYLNDNTCTVVETILGDS